MMHSISFIGLAGFLSLFLSASAPVSASNGLSAGKIVLARAHNAHIQVVKRAQRTTNADSKRCRKNATSTVTKLSTSAASKTSSASATQTPKKDNNNNNNNQGGSAPAVPHSRKLGLVWAAGDDQIWPFAKGQNQLLYNWAVDPPSTAKQAGFNFMPMLWGRKNVDGGCQWNGGCFSKIKASDYNTVMFINEPNEPGQANMGVGEAVKLWWQYMQPLANQGVRTVGAVMSSNPNGKTWTKDFYNQCKGCKVDIQPAHYYDITPEGMIQYLKDYRAISNRPVMVTEWACQNYNDLSRQCSRGEIENFNRKVVSFMESTSWVIAYMPFGAMTGGLPDNVNNMNKLMNNDGSLTWLAKLIGY